MFRYRRVVCFCSFWGIFVFILVFTGVGDSLDLFGFSFFSLVGSGVVLY